MEPSYTLLFRRSARQWVALCLENGLVGQGETKERAAARLHEAIASFDEAIDDEQDIYHAPISVKELHEFLTFEQAQPLTTSYELRAVYA
ncbi:MAG: type II toxin-antitoxin system HicB family antitoxin [Anaerolineae bacterium]|jgi:predicted RNase H-like HicB family nuclease